jgi:hypothetical protein
LYIDDEDVIEDLRFSPEGVEFRMIIDKVGVQHYLDFDLENLTCEFER